LAAVEQPPIGCHSVLDRRRVGVLRGQAVVDRDDSRSSLPSEIGCQPDRGCGSPERVRAAVEVQDDATGFGASHVDGDDGYAAERFRSSHDVFRKRY
jgi:hypothetical protein